MVTFNGMWGFKHYALETESFSGKVYWEVFQSFCIKFGANEPCVSWWQCKFRNDAIHSCPFEIQIVVRKKSFVVECLSSEQRHGNAMKNNSSGFRSSPSPSYPSLLWRILPVIFLVRHLVFIFVFLLLLQTHPPISPPLHPLLLHIFFSLRLRNPYPHNCASRVWKWYTKWRVKDTIYL
jgi:hypothetical protein